MSNYLFSREDLGSIAQNVLDFLDEKEINFLSDLNALTDKNFLIKNIENEQIKIRLRPSNFLTEALTVDYAVADAGIPMEVRFNSRLHYSVIIVKGNFELEGYNFFKTDDFGNKAQQKRFSSVELSSVREELESLVKY